MELQEMVPDPKDIKNLLISYRDQWTQKEFQNYTKTYWCTLDEPGAIIFKSQFLLNNTEDVHNITKSVFHWETVFVKNIENKELTWSKARSFLINGLYFLRLIGPVLPADWSWNQLICG